jgi:hypothetical protein
LVEGIAVRGAIFGLALGPFIAAGCLQLDLGDPADSGAAPAAPSSGSSADAGTFGGTLCAVDALSKTTLCTSIDPCPGLAVDHDVFPDCGFRVPSLAIDLQCVCGDSLCPMGTSLTCAQAQALLSNNSELSVCTQELEGRCALRGTSTPTTSTCDRSCASECAGDPGCIGLCGC